jgi:CRP/FNR family transcriptional regulator, cyclic AMP receptor protein
MAGRIIWSAALLGVALLILAAGILARRAARLTLEEQAMADRLFKGVGRSSVRHLIDQGYWLSGRPGEVLLREGEPVTRFCYLSEGEARVMMAGRPIGFSRGGDVIGGLGFFSGETAAATVILTSSARFWCAPAERFHPYLAAQPDLRRKLRRNMGGGVTEEPEEDEPVSGDAPAAVPAE